MKKYSEDPIEVPRFNEANGFYTTKERSDLMGKIKAKDTKPEIALRKSLWNLGYRYRKNVKQIVGRPDIVFRKYKLVVFVDGEFWHGFNWEIKKDKIKSNREFWIPKIERNIQRDKKNIRELENAGWTVMRFWEHEIKKDLGGCLNQITKYIEGRELIHQSSS